MSWNLHDLLIKQDLPVDFACNVYVIYDLLFILFKQNRQRQLTFFNFKPR